MSEVFDSAKFYSCMEPDVLEHESWEEAVAEFLDAWLDDVRSRFPEDGYLDLDDAPDWWLERELMKNGPVCVAAYNPKVVSEDRKKEWASSLARRLQGWFDEEFGPPEGTVSCAGERVMEKLHEAVDIAATTWQVWQCDLVESHLFQFDAVLRVAREEFPEYFRDPKGDE